MIVVKLMGGLGNQMFQYAFGQVLSNRFHQPIFYDKSWFKHDFADLTPRNFNLEMFGFASNCIDPTRLFFTNNQHSWLKILKQKIKGKIVCEKIYEESFSFEQIKPQRNFYLEGYWQKNYEYYDYENVRDIILTNSHFSELTSPEDINLQGMIRDSESVAVHIRRGDYVNNAKVNQLFGTCSLNYYKDASNKILSEIPNAKFFLFTDDPNYVKTNFGFLQNATLVSDNRRSEVNELNLMRLCKNFIIANSSFSWWGAWLSQNPDKIVIAPQPWFNDQEVNKKFKNVPKDWIRI